MLCAKFQALNNNQPTRDDDIQRKMKAETSLRTPPTSNNTPPLPFRQAMFPAEFKEIIPPTPSSNTPPVPNVLIIGTTVKEISPPPPSRNTPPVVLSEPETHTNPPRSLGEYARRFVQDAVLPSRNTMVMVQSMQSTGLREEGLIRSPARMVTRSSGQLPSFAAMQCMLQQQRFLEEDAFSDSSQEDDGEWGYTSD